MNSLQKAVEKSLRGLPALGVANLLKRKFSEQGVDITNDRARSMAQQLLAGKSDFSLPGNRTEPLKITLTEQDAEGVVKWVDLFLERDLGDLISRLRDDLASRTLKTLKKRWPVEYRTQRREIFGFRNRLRDRWKTGISKLHMLITMARELGDNINRDARRNPRFGPALVDVLTRLHARSCQVAEEVIVLLETGFANGAMARWRTMHEIVVTASFLSEHGSACAERYVDHQIVESFKAAQEYEIVHTKLGYAAISATDMERMRSQYDQVIKTYGNTFGAQYGWAAKELGLKQPTFRDIERAAKVDWLRGHYRMASHGVHANPKGIFFSMASRSAGILLSGPSNAGLADPGDCAAHSLLMISAILVSLSSTFDHLVALQMMDLLREEVGMALLHAHRKLDRDEKKLRPSKTKASASRR